MRTLFAVPSATLVAGLLLAAPYAHAEIKDVTDHISAGSCQIPSDDQNGTASVVVNKAGRPRQLVLELRFQQGVSWKMVTYPLQLISLDTTEGILTMQIQFRPGEEAKAIVHKDSTGELRVVNQGRQTIVPLSNCHFKL